MNQPEENRMNTTTITVGGTEWVRGDDNKFRIICGGCDGTRGHTLAPAWARVFGTDWQPCADCNGEGFRLNTDAGFATATVIVRTEKQLAAQARRIEAKVRAEAERAAEAQARREAAIARHAHLVHIDANIGDTVTVTGTVDACEYVTTAYGDARLFTVAVDANTIVKFFSNGRAFDHVFVGHTITITAIVKSFDEYKGRKSTTVSRPNLHIH